MEFHDWKKLIAIVVLIAFTGMATIWTAEQAVPAFQENVGTPVVKKHKKFPWLLAVLSVAAVGSVAYLLLKKKKNNPPPEPPLTPSLPDYEQLVTQFAYDTQLPLDIQETQVEDRGTAKVHHLSFACSYGGRSSSLLVVPDGQGPFAAVVFLHCGQCTVYEFLQEALDIADHGVISIMISPPTGSASETIYVKTVIALRRAVDLLLARSDVAPGRIGYVGHSFGATWGGVLAGIEKRLKAYVLMCGHGKIGICANCNENVPESLWACHYIGHAAPAALLFQFAQNDEYITINAANEYFQAASEPKTILWYDAYHALNTQAQIDRINWLKSQLGLN